MFIALKPSKNTFSYGFALLENGLLVMDWIFVPLFQVFVFPYSHNYDDVLICHARLDHKGQKNIYTKVSKIRFLSKHKWSSPHVNTVK